MLIGQLNWRDRAYANVRNPAFQFWHGRHRRTADTTGRRGATPRRWCEVRRVATRPRARAQHTGIVLAAQGAE